MSPALFEAVCCRSWPVLLGTPLGRCGYCHQRPIILRPMAPEAAA